METNTVLYLTLPIAAIFISVLLADRLIIRRSPTNHSPCSHLIIGNLVGLIRNRHRFHDWASELLSCGRHTIEVRGPLGLSCGVCTADPRVVDYILRSNFSNYAKGCRTRSVLSDLLGSGIFNTDAHLWLLQRKLAAYEFTARSLRSFAAGVVRSQLDGRLLPLLSAAEEPLDLQDLFRRFTFDNICAMAFGTDPATLGGSTQQQSFFHCFDEAVEISSARLFSPFPIIWKLKRYLDLGSEKRLRIAVQNIDEYAMNIIASKEKDEQGNKKQDLLSRFMAAVDHDKEELGTMLKSKAEKARFLRDIIVSFILAGKDSTSSALTWFFWLISVNSRCEQRIYEEVRETEGLGGDEIKGMHYLHAAISESMRLYPPVPINSRVAVEDDVLPDGTRVGAGWFADYSAYAMGRSEDVWGEDCREFVPERWLDKKGEFVAVEACRFPVFHAGPRMCLEKELAYLQMKMVAATVIGGFTVEHVGALREDPPPYELSVTLRMKGGFPVRFKKRREE